MQHRHRRDSFGGTGRHGSASDFFGISLPWLAVVLLYMAAVLFFIYLAARRKMGSERIHPLSKPQSIAALVTLAAAVGRDIWRREEFAVLEVATLYLLVITAILLILMVTPNRAEYVKGLWRAGSRGWPPAVVGRPVAQPRFSGDRVRHRAGDRDRRLERPPRRSRPVLFPTP